MGKIIYLVPEWKLLGFDKPHFLLVARDAFGELWQMSARHPQHGPVSAYGRDPQDARAMYLHLFCGLYPPRNLLERAA